MKRHERAPSHGHANLGLLSARSGGQGGDVVRDNQARRDVEQAALHGAEAGEEAGSAKTSKRPTDTILMRGPKC